MQGHTQQDILCRYVISLEILFIPINTVIKATNVDETIYAQFYSTNTIVKESCL